ncbi:MAG: cytochrome bc complex cytochrome b subunit [Chloroflexi bacterium]|nr:cytochrome bc complex cytochrome b subunit [Chloroflexota bacterium]
MKPNRFHLPSIAALIAAAGLAIFILVLLPSRGQETVEATPIQSDNPLDKPIVSEPPTQLDEGALLFWGVCMACHGNAGQGLTDEWREVAFGEDMDCWTSKCHASNHPPQGFEFPRIVPALAGGGKLGRFTSAQQLYDYVYAMMPWWNQGSLTTDQAWQVTAFLLKMNDTLPAGIPLDGKVASAIPVHRKLNTPQNDVPFSLALAAALVLIMLGWLAQEALRPAPVPAEPAAGDRPKGRPQRPNFIYHLHPPAIPAAQARWRYTLGAGGMAVFLMLVLAVTGLLEMFYYIPTPEEAAISVQTIHFFVPLGALVRNLHFWSAQLLVVVAALHMLRVIFTGAYASPRRFNYLLGLGLFVLALLLDFTGYVLRWDEGIRWALTAGTNLLASIPWVGEGLFRFVVGSSQVGPSTLVRFYTWHIYALTGVAGFVMIWHLFRVRRDGGIASPPPTLESTPPRITRFDLVRREVLGMFLAGIVLILMSIFLPAPLADPIRGTPTLATDTRAPWFFLWVQQLLKLGDPFLLGVLVPVAVVGVLGLIPYLLPAPAKEELGRWFPARGRIAQILVAVLLLVILGLTALAALTS